MFAQITFPEPFSNRADFFLPSLGLFDDDTGDQIDLVALGVTFQFEIRKERPSTDGYVPWFVYGVDEGPLITASLGNGISIVDTGIIQILILEAQFRDLTPGTYLAALTAADNQGNTRQIFIAKVPVLYGGVTS